MLTRAIDWSDIQRNENVYPGEPLGAKMWRVFAQLTDVMMRGWEVEI